MKRHPKTCAGCGASLTKRNTAEGETKKWRHDHPEELRTLTLAQLEDELLLFGPLCELAGFLGRLPRIFREAASILSGLLRSLRCRPSGLGSFPSLLCENTRLLGGFSQRFKFLSDRFGDRPELLGGFPVRLVCHAPKFCLRARGLSGLPLAVLLFTTSLGRATRPLYTCAFAFRVGARGLLRTHAHSPAGIMPASELQPR
ncbi:MAG TPA: hypothetical protein VFT23_12980 [Burkholderiales bacterium]|nr:hypothetical protein [Burkholderiales bacterium]